MPSKGGAWSFFCKSRWGKKKAFYAFCLSRHAGNVFFHLLDLVGNLGGGWLESLGLFEIVLACPEFPFVDHDGR